jgi:RNA-directed DNA polymerase
VTRDPVDLARALALGPWEPQPMLIRASLAGGRLRADPWTERLVASLLRRWPERPTAAEIAAYVLHFPVQPDDGRDIDHPPTGAQRPAAPAPVAIHRPITALHDRASIAALLGIDNAELAWLADRQNRAGREPRPALMHYRYRARGARLLEMPKPRLREAQRRLLRHLIRAFPLHPAAHGSVTGHNVLSAVTEHAGRPILVRCDLRAFFPSVTSARVTGLMRSTGLDDEASSVVAGLCTAVVPASVRHELRGHPAFADWPTSRLLAAAHLPQGAPSSPGLANAIAFSLDHRLAALAESLSARYTRYVDDLVFSGPSNLPLRALLRGVSEIAAAEGFRLNQRKTFVRRCGSRQKVLGVVVNDRPHIDRRELDELRAILHNCRRHGVRGQSRGRSAAELRVCLLGRIGWVSAIDPERGRRLRADFDLISWPCV